MSTFQKQFNTSVKKELMKDLGIKNPLAVPTFTKIVVNIGVGESVQNKKAVDRVREQLEQMTGQKAMVTLARKSISSFKIRKGFPIGAKVTLRGKRMYDFLDKLIHVVLPRLRDFRGISEKSIDQHGNLNLGFTEQTIFPEIEYDKIDKLRGLEITIVTSTRSREHGVALFKKLQIPFIS
ncbi:50S ribosomal protein L5 [Candidatus Woesebacteria bacterium]|nr:50S ribosomal protein L5 [Candidatus Woesebacteria bacterium]